MNTETEVSRQLRRARRIDAARDILKLACIVGIGCLMLVIASTISVSLFQDFVEAPLQADMSGE